MEATTLPPLPDPARARGRPLGFTLVELMIVVAIIGILAAIAIPSYNRYVLKARRVDAHTALTTLQQAQERYRISHTTYAADLSQLGLNATSPEGHYRIEITANSASATGYAASAIAQASQQRDTGCTTISVTYNAGQTVYTPADCWK